MNSLPRSQSCQLRNRAPRYLCLRSVARCILAATLLCAAPALHAQTPTFTGHVEDSTGAIIPNAKVELQRPNGTVVTTTLTDATGQFHIAQPTPGDYRLNVLLDGFDPLTRPLHITGTTLTPLTLTLAPASVSTNVTVNAEQNADLTAPDQNQDVPTITSNDMKTLPILDGDIISTLSAFLDSGATGEGGVALMIDGVEMKSLGVDPSAIERVTINQDPYTARYRQPGKGQIDVTTKNTSTKFHGALNFAFRDSALNAVNHYAKTKPPEQRRTYGGYLTGPIKPLNNTTFLFSANRREQSFSQQVSANTAPDVTTTENVPAPATNTTLSLKVAHQISDHHSDFLLYRFYDSSASNQNVGGLTLSTAGTSDYGFDMDLTFHDDFDFSPTAINQFSFVFERNVDRTVSNQQAPALIVQGAFIGGGAQADSLQTETKPNITEIVSWTTHKIHQLRFGLQLTNLGPFVLDDNTNRQGTYTFETLADFEANSPSSYSLQQGQSSFRTYQMTPSGFFQDQIQLTPYLSVTPGVRYDFQSALPGTMDAVLPRVSLAYVVDKKHGLVVRTGSGIYMRRIGVNNPQQLARYEHAAERSLLITTGACYDPQRNPCNMIVAQPPNLFNYEPNIKAPMQAYFGLSVEHQLTAKSTITLSYDGYRGWHALRSVDINAPLPPFTSSARPNPNFAQILQLQSGGYQKSDAMTLSYRGRIGNLFSGFADYIYQHADSNTQFSTFLPQNQYNPNDEWSRTNADQRQQFKFFGIFYPDKPTTLGIGFYNYTPAPYTVTTGNDDYYTGFFNARPAGVPRNSLNGGSYQDLQVRLGYTFKLQPHLKDDSPTLAVSISSFNTLNRPNYEGFVGVKTSSLFMHPTSADPPRRLQLGANYNF